MEAGLEGWPAGVQPQHEAATPSTRGCGLWDREFQSLTNSSGVNGHLPGGAGSSSGPRPPPALGAWSVPAPRCCSNGWPCGAGGRASGCCLQLAPEMPPPAEDTVHVAPWSCVHWAGGTGRRRAAPQPPRPLVDLTAPRAHAQQVRRWKSALCAGPGCPCQPSSGDSDFCVRDVASPGSGKGRAGHARVDS